MALRPNRPRDEPLGLPPEAIGGPPVQARKPISVTVWVPFSVGYEQVHARAIAWTDRAVLVDWKPLEGPVLQVWVWAKAVRRRSSGLLGPPATERPELIAYRGPN